MTSPRVFRRGDPPPDDSVRTVLDSAGRVWPRIEGTDEFTSPTGDRWPFSHVLALGPLVECQPLTDYDAAVEADYIARKLVGHVMYGRAL